MAEMDRQDFDLHSVIDGAVGPFLGLFDLKIRIHPAVPPAFKGDAAELCRVLANLLAYALKQTERGPVEVFIRAVDDTGHKLEFNIQGTGIFAEKRDQILFHFPLRESVHAMGGEIGFGSSGSDDRLWFTAQFEVAETTGEFNETQLNKLAFHDSGENSLLKVLTEDFFTHGRGLVEAMVSCARKNEIEKMRDLAHCLRSPSLTLGLTELAALCAELEKTRLEPRELEEKLVLLTQLYDRAGVWLCREGLSSRAS